LELLLLCLFLISVLIAQTIVFGWSTIFCRDWWETTECSGGERH